MNQPDDGLTPEELATHDAAALPDREAMSTIPTSLLDLDVNLDAALDLAAPVDAGIALNANAALPIDAAVSANILSPGAESGAQAEQVSVINQDLDGVAIADPDQTSNIEQGETVAGAETTVGTDTTTAAADTTAATAGTDAAAGADTTTTTTEGT
jgi:hypothetical protein